MKCDSADKTASKTIPSQHPIITAQTPSQTKSEKSGILKSQNGTNQADGLSDTGTIVPIAVGVAVAVLIVVVIVIAVVMMRKNKRGAG